LRARPACTRYVFAALLFALVAAGPAQGGPTQPPTGSFAGFVTRFTTPPIFLFGQSPFVTCFNPSNRPVTFGVEYFDADLTSDPNRGPVGTIGPIVLDPAEALGGGIGSSGVRVIRVLVGHKKDVVDCFAQVNDAAGIILEIPLRPVGKKKR
jgi:hypothetical protein